MDVEFHAVKDKTNKNSTIIYRQVTAYVVEPINKTPWFIFQIGIIISVVTKGIFVTNIEGLLKDFL